MRLSQTVAELETHANNLEIELNEVRTKLAKIGDLVGEPANSNETKKPSLEHLTEAERDAAIIKLRKTDPKQFTHARLGTLYGLSGTRVGQILKKNRTASRRKKASPKPEHDLIKELRALHKQNPVAFTPKALAEFKRVPLQVVEEALAQ